MEHTNEIKMNGEPGLPRAWAEVYRILMKTPKSVQICIPRKFWSYIRRNMDETWAGNLDFSKRLEDMDLLEDTKFLLIMIYRDFICDPEERKEMIREEKRAAILGGWEYTPTSLMDLI